MRVHGLLTALITMVMLAPAAAGAQERPRTYSSATLSSRGMLGFYSEPMHDAAAPQRLVVRVVPESPAHEAGLRQGDILLRIDGLAASEQVIAAPVEPGDTVVLRIRRDGSERDITVVAAERSSRFRYVFPDSLDERFAVTFERMRASVDSAHARPSSVFRRIQSDSGTIVILGTDTLHVTSGVPARIRGTHIDSIVRYRSERLPRILSDSARFHIFTPGEGRTFTFHTDSNFVHGFEVLRSSAAFGLRAVAGAELAPLNPALAEYFGATDGVLVLDAAEHTPAERAGLRGGDIIVNAGGTAVRSIAELRRAIEAASGDVNLRVLRHGRNVDVTLSHAP